MAWGRPISPQRSLRATIKPSVALECHKTCQTDAKSQPDHPQWIAGARRKPESLQSRRRELLVQGGSSARASPLEPSPARKGGAPCSGAARPGKRRTSRQARGDVGPNSPRFSPELDIDAGAAKHLGELQRCATGKRKVRFMVNVPGMGSNDEPSSMNPPA